MPDRLNRYEKRTSTPLLVFALLFIALYALPVVEPDLPVASLVGVVTAAVAAWFISVTATSERRTAATDERLARMEQQLADITAALNGRQDHRPSRREDGPPSTSRLGPSSQDSFASGPPGRAR